MRVEPTEQLVHLGTATLAWASAPRTGGSHREPGQVPAGVLTELPDPEVLTEGQAEEAGVGPHHLDHRAQVRWTLQRPSPEGVGQVSEQPGTTEAAPSHHHSVASGGRHHGQRIGRLPQVAVAQHRDGGDQLP